MLLQANPNPPWLGKPTSTEKPGEASELTDDMSGFTADCGDAPVTGEGRWGSSGAAGVGGGRPQCKWGGWPESGCTLHGEPRGPDRGGV